MKIAIYDRNRREGSKCMFIISSDYNRCDNEACNNIVVSNAWDLFRIFICNRCLEGKRISFK